MILMNEQEQRDLLIDKLELLYEKLERINRDKLELEKEQ
ncbi:hypothetical protein LCGC14_1382820 [marine sediment metagenome]|uniref:Uncharacterized protein n=1 Tax=marine sediment metagenome TaxID=412755 RepID=A0A0F9K2E9_9ZZZZ